MAPTGPIKVMAAVISPSMSKMGADSDVKCGSSAWRQRLMWCFCTSSRMACTSFAV
ncbi:hypothetical protein D3C72_2192900 [compost metagenome]